MLGSSLFAFSKHVEVYEFTRQSGDLKGKKWRKIRHVSSGEVYPSYNLASKHGFNPDTLKATEPLEVD